MPVDSLLSNWAYMVMATLAWTLEAWFWAVTGRHRPLGESRCGGESRRPAYEIQRLSSRLLTDPVQVVRTSRLLVFRLLA